MTLTNNQKIYIYGGSFNPPTIAHQAIAEACLAQPECQELWLMPSGSRADKSIDVSKEHRLELLDEFVGSILCTKNIRVEHLEIDRQEMTQTYMSVDLLQSKYPDKRFRYIFGSDSYNSMQTWENGASLKNDLDMLIIPRDGEVVEDVENIRVLKSRIPAGISSSEVRTRIQSDNYIGDLVCGGVERYIRKSKLYVQ